MCDIYVAFSIVRMCSMCRTFVQENVLEVEYDHRFLAFTMRLCIEKSHKLDAEIIDLSCHTMCLFDFCLSRLEVKQNLKLIRKVEYENDLGEWKERTLILIFFSMLLQ